MEEASFTGTLRTVLVLLIVWLAIRLVARWLQPSDKNSRRRMGWSRPDGRKPGDVRIEEPSKKGGSQGGDGPVEDADFEEVR